LALKNSLYQIKGLSSVMNSSCNPMYQKLMLSN
jgi:hypothetical protein